MHQCDFLNFCGALGLQPGPHERVSQRAAAPDLRRTQPESLLRSAPRADRACSVFAIAQEVIETRRQSAPHAAAHETILGLTTRARLLALGHDCAYLLGLLAMIKCSICSYQCDNWYVSNWRLACHIYFSVGRCPLELAQGLSRVAPILHLFGRSAPFGVTFVLMAGRSALPPRDAGDLLKGASPPPPPTASAARQCAPRDGHRATPVTCSRPRRPPTATLLLPHSPPSPPPPPPHLPLPSTPSSRVNHTATRAPTRRAAMPAT